MTKLTDAIRRITSSLNQSCLQLNLTIDCLYDPPHPKVTNSIINPDTFVPGDDGVLRQESILPLNFALMTAKKCPECGT